MNQGKQAFRFSKIMSTSLLKAIILLLGIFIHLNSNGQDSSDSGAIGDYINLYRKYLSEQRSGQCQMHPSCSHYGEDAMKSKGVLVGMINTSDRLLRCSHDLGNYKSMSTEKGWRFWDPVNDSIYTYEDKSSFFWVDTTSYMTKEMTLVQHLMNNEYYQNAFGELQSIRFKSDTFSNELWVYMNIIRCLNAMDMEESALREFISSFPEDIRQNPAVLLEITRSLINIKNYYQANIYLKNVEKQTEVGSDLYAKYLLYKGYIESKEQKFEEAITSFTQNQSSSYYGAVAQYNKRQLLEIRNVKHKSPLLAGVLGIIPGGGYLYAGHKGSAVSALLINGLLFYATYTSIKSENYGVAALTGIFSMSFYIGNISGGVKSAKRYNTQQKQNILDRITIIN